MQIKLEIDDDIQIVHEVLAPTPAEIMRKYVSCLEREAKMAQERIRELEVKEAERKQAELDEKKRLEEQRLKRNEYQRNRNARIRAQNKEAKRMTARFGPKNSSPTQVIQEQPQHSENLPEHPEDLTQTVLNMFAQEQYPLNLGVPEVPAETIANPGRENHQVLRPVVVDENEIAEAVRNMPAESVRLLSALIPPGGQAEMIIGGTNQRAQMSGFGALPPVSSVQQIVPQPSHFSLSSQSHQMGRFPAVAPMNQQFVPPQNLASSQGQVFMNPNGWAPFPGQRNAQLPMPGPHNFGFPGFHPPTNQVPIFHPAPMTWPQPPRGEQMPAPYHAGIPGAPENTNLQNAERQPGTSQPGMDRAPE